MILELVEKLLPELCRAVSQWPDHIVVSRFCRGNVHSKGPAASAIPLTFTQSGEQSLHEFQGSLGTGFLGERLRDDRA